MTRAHVEIRLGLFNPPYYPAREEIGEELASLSLTAHEICSELGHKLYKEAQPR